MTQKNILLLILLLSSGITLANNEMGHEINLFEKDDFTKNSIKIYNVDERLNHKINREIKLDIPSNIESTLNIEKNENEKDKYMLNKYCKEELNLFCKEDTDKNQCLISFKKLLTGKCLLLINESTKKGINIYNKLSIHDLKLPYDTKFYGYKRTIAYNIGMYNSKKDFKYRGIDFRKGFLKARNYNYDNYKKQFVIYAAKPKKEFRDNANILYNPHWQKGDFFFDEKGNVTTGTLGESFIYNKNITLKKGSLIAFNEKRELVRGILEKPIRIGKCAFLEDMIIDENKIKECLEKKI